MIPRTLWIPVHTAFALITILFAPQPVESAALRVPDDFKTLQAAMTGASEGDSLLVAGGLYRECTVGKKGVILLGGWSDDFTRRDPERWISIVEGDGRDAAIFEFLGSGNKLLIIDGFTIRNGWFDAGNGGGVLIHGEWNAEIRNNRFTSNYARYHGGAVCYYRGARGVVENNIFQRNSAVFHGGAVALLENAKVEVRGNIFRDNFVLFDSGGGVAALKDCELTVRANRFEGNDARMRGGAVSFLQNVVGSVEGNLIVGNQCGYKGGAVFSWKSTLICSGNTLVRNYSSLSGGIRVDNGGRAEISANVVLRSPGPWLYQEGEVELVASKNIVWGCENPEGVEALVKPLRTDPLLCDEVSDQRPRPESPCRTDEGIGCYRSTCGEPLLAGEPPPRWAGSR